MIFLPLRLEGPLQSWGGGAGPASNTPPAAGTQFGIRDTRDLPTLSGVVGLLSCALGYGRSDQRIVDLAAEVRLACRQDRAGVRWSDFQTVEGVVQAAGGSSKHPALTRRVYLSDACLLAIVAGPQELLEQCAAALQCPVWPYFLGRKSCPPAVPVYPALLEHPWHEADSLREAVLTYPRLTMRTEYRLRSLEYEASIDEERAMLDEHPDRVWHLYDRPIGLREFDRRTVIRETL